VEKNLVIVKGNGYRRQLVYCITVLALAVLIGQRQSEPGWEPVLSRVDELKERYSACLHRFSSHNPSTQAWLSIIRESGSRFPVLSRSEMMARAEAAAQSEQDWMDCGSMWATMKCHDGRQRASRCRLQGLRRTRMMTPL
jgi:hypothetical protein